MTFPMPRPLWRLVALLACSAAAQATPPEPVQQALQAAGLPESALAYAAVPLGHHGRAVGWQATRPMQPGSTMKLVTSIVTLDVLGPNHRGFTELVSAAPRRPGPDGDVLDGDLVLRGGGDVELGVPQLWALLMELRESGVRELRGDVLLDRSRYDPPRADLGLPPFDSAPEFPYNVIPDALNVAGSLLPLKLQATADGVVATTVPALDGLVIDARGMALVDARCADWDDHWKPATTAREGGVTTITLHGAFPRDCSVRPNLQLLDRDELAERLLRTLWRGLGGRFTGRLREGTAPAGAAVLARRQGRPWGELMRPLNKISDNAWTRVLFHELGVAAPAGTAGPTAQRADSQLRDWLRRERIDAAALVSDNGSGLSRSERVSAQLLAEMLRAAWQGRHRHDLLATLPTVGVDGTMRLRLRESPATGWARLKTGTLRNVVGLAGVMRDGDGRDWAVAMLINDEGAARGRPVLDALVDHWARSAPDAVAAPRVGPQGEGP
ncbi:MAG: D-alanyl-D-alanine carboxypeptidase/D-alanyl-D-alanine-endopeptidase [Rubrivivax sp.]|nr:D-alanyl-D-alanine carboxypeptidase/D-alanyl-D-alanine-endopeptidase [Rubrivivax sp.]